MMVKYVTVETLQMTVLRNIADESELALDWSLIEKKEIGTEGFLDGLLCHG
jgi:hypothetical protein